MIHCNLDKLASLSQEQTIAQCSQCSNAQRCDFGLILSNEIRMFKSDQGSHKEPNNLTKLAMESQSFAEFHEKTEKHDRLFRGQQRNYRFTKQAQQPKNLKQLAQSCMTFSDFHAKATGE